MTARFVAWSIIHRWTICQTLASLVFRTPPVNPVRTTRIGRPGAVPKAAARPRRLRRPWRFADSYKGARNEGTHLSDRHRRHIACTGGPAAGFVAGLLLVVGTAHGQLDEWIDIKPTGTDALYGVHFPVDSRTGWICGANGALFKTTDGGRSWTAQSVGATPLLSDVHFTDVSKGFVCADDAKVYDTTDGGSNWSSTALSGALNGIGFATSRQGYVVGAGGAMFKTVDGGANWVDQAQVVSAETFHAVDFPAGATTGWVSGTNGTVLKRTGQHMVTGIYSGDGNPTQQITGLGFQPDVVIVRANTITKIAWITTSAMPADTSKPFGTLKLKSDRIVSLDADGFTVGDHHQVNDTPFTYYFYAWKAEAGVLKVDTYTGNGSPNSPRWINIGMQPAYVIVFREDTAVDYSINHRFSTQAVGACFKTYDHLSPGINRILDFNATGFQIGTNYSQVNASGAVYQYIAWAEVAGKMKVGTYTGTGSDDRVFSGLGFRPEVVLIESESTTAGDYSMIRSEAIIGDFAQCVVNDSAVPTDDDAIQRLDDDGFQIGTTQNVASGGAWYNASWTYRKKLTIDNTKVTATLANFPVLISMTDTDLQAARADGFDILFTDDDAVTKLDHEIEKWDDGTGELIAWVRVPSLPDTVNKDIYVYYGYASATDQQNVNGVWDSNFKAVLHLGEAVTDEATSTNAHDDSTSNNNDGDQYNNGPAAGPIDMGQDFDGTDDRIIIPHAASLDATGPGLTVSAWIQPDFLNDSVDRVIADKWLSNAGWKLWFKDSKNDFRFKARIAGQNKSATTSGATWTAETKHYVVGVYDGGRIRIYLDGVEGGSTVATGNLVASTEDLTIGINAGSTDDPFHGGIDEVRISDTRRTAGWIQTEYNNQNDPATFFTVGAEETSGGGDTYHWVAWGGKWDAQTTPNTETLSGMAMVDESTGFCVGSADTVLYTTDGGTTWTDSPTGSGIDLEGVSFPTASIGYVSGAAGRIFRSADGGLSWTERTTATSDLLRDIHFPEDATTGFAVGASSAVQRTERPLMITGTYVGDGTDDRAITGLGFQPDFMIIVGEGQPAVARTSTMDANETKRLDNPIWDRELLPDQIQLFAAGGFTIGTHDLVNKSGTQYFWAAFEAHAELKVGTYTGDGTASQSITGVGFQPDFVISLAEHDVYAVTRFDSNTPGEGGAFHALAAQTDAIKNFETDGFEVGSCDCANQSTYTYHYVAFKELPLQIETGFHTGDGWDDTSVNGIGFQPRLVIVQADTAQEPYIRMRSMGARDTSMNFQGDGSETNHIQAMEADGFQVGSDTEVNQLTTTYHWVAFARDGTQTQAKPRVIRWAEVEP